MTNYAPATQSPRLDCRFAHGGTWSGVATIVGHAFDTLRRRGDETPISRHAYALFAILADRRAEIPLRYTSLTDTAKGAERTRNFPLDRAYRIVNGAVDVVLAAAAHADMPTTFDLYGIDEAQHLARRFFAELERRGGGRFRFTAKAASDGTPPVDGAALEAALAAGDAPLADMEIAERHYPALAAFYRGRGDAAALAEIAVRAMCLNNHFGYYHESAAFLPDILPQFEALCAGDEDRRWNYLGNIYQGLVTTGRADAALDLLAREALPRISSPHLLAKVHYALAMLHLRYLDATDLARAATHLDTALALAREPDARASEADRVFTAVFIGNGIAFLRVRQGRPREAIALCQQGYAELTRALGDEKHRLHRSVLLYNSAQVFQMVGEPAMALDYYRQALRLDPHYAEYHNDIGNLLQSLGEFGAARDAYAAALEFSEPYPESHHNLGVCAANLGDWSEAARQFERCLELDPDQPMTRALRAEALAELGDPVTSRRELETAHRMAPDEPAILHALAVARFQSDDAGGALALMDRLVRLEASVADHYDNRAAAHAALGQSDAAEADRRTAQGLRAA